MATSMTTRTFRTTSAGSSVYISGAPLAYGAPDVVLTFTAPSVTSTTVLGFSCQENGCGPVVRHEGMLGSIIVTP